MVALMPVAPATLEYEEDELLDENQRGFYMVDNEIVFVFGSEIGALGIAVYNVLKAYSRPDPLTGRKAIFPGEAKIGSLINIHRTTVITYLQKLKSAGLLDVVPQYRADGGRTTNRYILRSVKRAVAFRSGTKLSVVPPSASAPPAPPPVRAEPGPPPLTRRAPKPPLTSPAYPVAVPTPLTLECLPPSYQEEVQAFTHIELPLALYRFAKHFHGERFATETSLWERLMGWLAEDEAETVAKAKAGGTNRHLRATVPDRPEPVAPTAGQAYFRYKPTGGPAA